MVMTIISPTCL